MGQLAATSRASVDFPAPARPSINTIGLAAATSTMASMTSAAARLSASATGSLLLEGTDDAGECATGDADERDRHSEKRDDVRFEPQPFLSSHVNAERNRHASSAASPVLCCVGAAAVSAPCQGHRGDAHPVDVPRLTVGVRHSE